MKLHIGQDGFSLKAEAFEDVVAILGRRGRGKTTTATVIVEGLHAAGARFVVADPVGVWYGLKSSRDGRHPGIPVVVMGGDHGDVPLAPESGEIIADFVADPTSPSVVLDLKLFTQGEMVRFMTAFLSRLYHVNPGKPLHVVLDEADQFAPQRPMPGEQAMLGAAQRVTKLGRAKGLHPILITQRPATLSKNVLTQAGMLIAHAITGPQDRNAVDDWIKANAEEGERGKFLAELSGLERGTAYFWSPDIPLFRQVAVRDRETFDSSATPKRGEAVKPKALAEVDLEALKGRIAATIEKAKADDPRELRKRIGELQAELRKRSSMKPQVTDGVSGKPPKRVEVPILKDAQVKHLDVAVQRMRDTDASFLRALAHWADKIAQRQQVVVSEAGLLRDVIEKALGASRAIAVPPPGRNAGAPTAPAPHVARVPVAARRATEPGLDGEVSGTQRKVLDTIAMLNRRGLSVTREAVARWQGIHPNGGRYLTDLATLRKLGHLDGLALTESGAARANGVETGKDEALKAAGLKDGTRRTILETVIEHGPLSREGLAEKLGIHPNGGRFLTGLAWLRVMGLIPERGEIKATDGVFA